MTFKTHQQLTSLGIRNLVIGVLMLFPLFGHAQWEPDTVRGFLSAQSHSDDSDELQLITEKAIQHHLGIYQPFDPELASALFHKAAMGGEPVALTILETMRATSTEEIENKPILFPITSFSGDLRRYFDKKGKGTVKFDAKMARKWIRKQAKKDNPIAVYNQLILEASPQYTGYLFDSILPYYQASEHFRRGSSENPPDPKALMEAIAVAEHPDAQMIALAIQLAQEVPTENTYDYLGYAIDSGSAKAEYVRLKYLNDSMLTENDDVTPTAEVLRKLCEQNYYPAWEYECVRLHQELATSTSTQEIGESHMQAVENALSYGYEDAGLGLLGTLLSMTQEPSIFEWGYHQYLKAAAMGVSSAYYSVGFCYRNGYGVERDPEMAKRWFESEKAQENPASSYQLGWMYFTEQRFDEALECFIKAGNTGHAMAQLQAGLFYLDGIGVESDLDEAYQWLEKSAEAGNEFASLFCGFYHDNAWIGDRDLDQSLYYYRKALIQQTPIAFNSFFSFIKKRIDDESGRVDAMLMAVDELYLWIPNNHLVELGSWLKKHPSWEPKQQWDASFKYFNFAAQKGDPSGKLMTSTYAIRGFPTSMDTKDAFNYLKAVVENDEKDGEFEFSKTLRTKAIIATCEAYLTGVGTEPNYEAYHQLRKSNELPIKNASYLDRIKNGSLAFNIYNKRIAHEQKLELAWKLLRKKDPELIKNQSPKVVSQLPASVLEYNRDCEISGDVTVVMFVDSQGNPQDVEVEFASHPSLREAALKAVQHWKFLPGFEDGQPTKSRIRAPISFRN